jgi:hypothetical protein
MKHEERSLSPCFLSTVNMHVERVKSFDNGYISAKKKKKLENIQFIESVVKNSNINLFIFKYKIQTNEKILYW